MKIISYRGPSSAGGLSSAIGHAWSKYSQEADLWWHLDKNRLHILSHHQKEQPHAKLSEELVEGHYRYCNEFLWPLMHDLGQYANYDPKHHRSYKQLNSFVAWAVDDSAMIADYFIHDYHFALLPRLLKQSNRSARTVVFWHIPWPQTTDSGYVAPLAEIAEELLSADVIGFHTQQYANCFMRFVERHLPQFICDSNRMFIRYSQQNNWPRNTESTEILVAPVGIDYNYWSSLANQKQHAFSHLAGKPYILSVDRVDYTKGIDMRLQAIDHFFESYPHWREQVSFVQVCDRTRPGIVAFDNYWDKCQQLKTKIEQKWNSEHWNPVVWLPAGLSVEQLAPIYAGAEIMLVNPIKDGLNLTAKEYVACQTGKSGVVALSPGAGVWQELGHYCLPIEPEQPEQIAQCINKALGLSDGEKAMRMSLLRDKVQANSLAHWWDTMTSKLTMTKEQNIQRHQASLVSLGIKK